MAGSSTTNANEYTLNGANLPDIELRDGDGNVVSSVSLASLQDDTDVSAVDLALSVAGVLTSTVTEDGNTLSDTQDLSVFFGPWDNPDASPATQGSGNIQYTAGDVGIGLTPLAGLHLSDSREFRQDFTSSGGGTGSYFQVANDGSGNFNQYWNSLGTTTPTRAGGGNALNQEFTGTSDWFQIRGADSDAAGTPIVWKEIHWLNMETAQHRFNEYGDGVFEDNNPAYILGVQADGDVVEIDPSTLGGAPSNTVFVDQTFDATFGLTNADIHNNGAIVQMTNKVLDAGWSRAANVVSYAGRPEKVKGYVSINAPDAGASSYWARPKLRVSRGRAIIAIIDDLVMQQNGTYDGDATVNGVFFDKQPGANPSYTFEWYDQENRTATLPPIEESQIALEATVKIEVYAP